MLTQVLLYLRFRHRLVALNRRLSGRSLSTDLLVSRVIARVGAARATWRALPGPFVLVAAALAAVVVAADLAWPTLFGDVGALADAVAAVRPYERAALAVLLAYLGAEGVHSVMARRRLASIAVAMDWAGQDRDRAVALGEVRDLGIHNTAFLRSMFAGYEPLRIELERRFPGLRVRSLDDRNSPAGAWVLPVPARLTDVVVEAPDIEVVTEADAARIVEGRLLRYARSAHARARFLAQLSGRHIGDDFQTRAEEGLNYVVRRLSWDAGKSAMRIEVDRARYGQIMRSCDYLIEEAFIAAGLCRAITTPKPRGALPLRGKWLMRTMPGRRASLRLGVDELLAEPRRRAAGVGLAGVVTFRDFNGSLIYYKRRSDDVGTYPNMYHAVPTGMFNSKTRDHPPNHDPRHHVGRVLLTEFVEECKSATDLEGFDDDPHWLAKLNLHVEWMLSDPQSYNERDGRANAADSPAAGGYDALQAAWAEQCPRGSQYDEARLKIYATGLALDLLSLRPEICCAIELDGGPLADITLNEEGTRKCVVPSESIPTIDDLPSSEEWVRSGYAAVHLAHEAIAAGLAPAAACGPADFGLGSLFVH